MAHGEPAFDDRDTMENYADDEGSEGGPEQRGLAAQDCDERVEEAKTVKGDGRAEPEDTQLLHATAFSIARSPIPLPRPDSPSAPQPRVPPSAPSAIGYEKSPRE